MVDSTAVKLVIAPIVVNAMLSLCNKNWRPCQQMYQSMVISHIGYMESLHLEAQCPGILVSREQ